LSTNFSHKKTLTVKLTNVYAYTPELFVVNIIILITIEINSNKNNIDGVKDLDINL